jgi:hypothetical protein
VRAASVVVLVVAGLYAEVAVAAPVRVRVDSQSCPDERASLPSRIEESTQGARGAADDAPLSLDLTLERASARDDADGRGRVGYVGTLRVSRQGAEAAERRVYGEACDAVADALVLMAALLVDRSEVTAPTPAAERTDTPSAAPPANATNARTDPGEPDAARAARGPLAAGAHLAYDALGVPALGPDAFVAFGGDREGVSPHFRVVASARFGDASPANARASFTRVQMRGEVCPVRLFGGALALRPCALAEGGVLAARGSGSALEGPGTRARPWAAAGGAGRAEVRVLGPAYLELEGGVLLPLVRDEFVLEPQVTVLRVPAAFFFASGGVSVRFR